MWLNLCFHFFWGSCQISVLTPVFSHETAETVCLRVLQTLALIQFFLLICAEWRSPSFFRCMLYYLGNRISPQRDEISCLWHSKMLFQVEAFKCLEAKKSMLLSLLCDLKLWLYLFQYLPTLGNIEVRGLCWRWVKTEKWW